jgi:UDP-4-amino-4,6-dideoxy-N-acetyl-beta-L-altrosamine transaminase
VSARHFLPYGRQQIDEDDIAAVVAALQGDYLTQGPTVGRFEAAVAEVCGASHAVACANGTAALHLATMAMGIGPGDAVIVPAMTFAATANAVLYTGATPVFADIDPASLTLAPASAEAAIRLAQKQGLRVKALYPVHYAGRPADMKALRSLADQHGMRLLEDACHALGARYRSDAAQPWQPVGSGLADVGAWSFHPVKQATTGEGGAVTTEDAALARRVRQLATHGITRDPDQLLNWPTENGPPPPWYMEMQLLGYNYRLCDIQAALGISQLAKLPGFVAARRDLVDSYRKRFAGMPLVTLPPGDSDTAWHSYHLFALAIDFDAADIDRANLMRRLQADGIGTQVHYIPVYEHPYYLEHTKRWLAVDCPVSKRWYNQALSVPLFPAMTTEDVDRVANRIAAHLEG